MTVREWAVETSDVAMLRSMALAFKQDRAFSFNRFDMAELMERCAEAAVSGLIEIGGTDDGQTILLEKTPSGKWRATGSDIRIHVLGKTPAAALRRAAMLMEDLEDIAGAAQGDQP